ncbi:Nudix family hydrolase [Pseudomonas sp. gcc21]|uniref:Nudix family hydrolase n=1 Tax=Pseudomonas sp. gcc21 TaxID=2726989 RepID=UPI0014516214|nr:Nudix family hydrolase [Pseudomonas sp. gcc21]QJD59070.1 Nudix family hydrolase [Pseudomonas sp. gcc21]
MRRIHVMAAVICNASGKILIARRPDHAHQGGLWEFPGGKLEDGETRFDGLRRELREELGIEVTQARPLLDIRHDYSDKSVRLDVWRVTAFAGEAHGAEGQPVRWVDAAELDQYPFPEANVPIVAAAQLPELYLVTPDVANLETLIEGLENARQRGIRLIQLRQTHLAPGEYRMWAETVLERFGADFTIMLKGNLPPSVTNAGWHLTASQLRDMAVAGRDHAEFNGWLAASCHNTEELEMASRVGVDFVTLSPVLPTQTHPDAKPLGWDRAAELIAQVNMPVYLLGGLGAADLERTFEVGGQGVAGIRGIWELPS